MNDDAKVNRSALFAGALRASHMLWDEPPWIVADPYAWLWNPEESRKVILKSRERVGAEACRAMRAAIVWRARMTEDAVLAACDRGIGQYAILGAGLDSFAWRYADRMPALRVFEIDHPATQAWKRAMIAEAGAAPPPGLHFVPADLGDMPVQRALAHGGWDFTRPGFISWIAVTMYLPPDAVAATLTALSTLGAGTTVALTYLQPEQALDVGERDILATFRGTTTASGEPCTTHYANTDMHALLSAAGFSTVALHAPRASSYFRDRRDGLMPHNVEMLAVASVA